LHLHPSENATSVRALWKQVKSEQADTALWNSSASANWTSDGNETTGVLPYEAAIVYGMNEIILTNLKHYQEYNIEVCSPSIVRDKLLFLHVLLFIRLCIKWLLT